MNSVHTPQVSTRIEHPTSVDAAIMSRFSARAFLPVPVPRDVVSEILRISARAPSGTNTQPWRVYVVEGAPRQQIERDVCTAHDAVRADPALAAQYREEYDYYPEQWVSPYIDRRRENGWGLYGLLGIAKGDKDAMHRQHQRNFRFFDAPMGMFFTIDRVMGRGSLVDSGMFIQNVMVAARARGLHTCPQAAWNGFARIIQPIIGMADNEMMVCGMSIGYADESSTVNGFHTPRVAVEDFTRWVS